MGKNSAHSRVIAAGKFLLGIAVLFMLLSFFLSLIPLTLSEQFYAYGTLAALNALGFGGTVIVQEPVLLVLDALSVPVGISYLCTGILELSLVWSAVIASAGVGAGKRAAGVAAGTAVLVFFNFLRIISSILIILFFGFDAGNFSHDALFRVFLFATIAGFYYFWLNWATEGKIGNGAGRGKGGRKRPSRA